jgi:hypothetical protein
MIFEEEKKPSENKEKEWENPIDPAKVTDERDKRRHDNLSENKQSETNTDQ